MCEECAEESQLYARDLFIKLRRRVEELELRVATHENVLAQEVL